MLKPKAFCVNGINIDHAPSATWKNCIIIILWDKS